MTQASMTGRFKVGDRVRVLTTGQDYGESDGGVQPEWGHITAVFGDDYNVLLDSGDPIIVLGQVNPGCNVLAAAEDLELGRNCMACGRKALITEPAPLCFAHAGEVATWFAGQSVTVARDTDGDPVCSRCGWTVGLAEEGMAAPPGTWVHDWNNRTDCHPDARVANA